MQLVTGTDALKSEVYDIVGNSLNDPLTTSYVSELLLSPRLSSLQEMKLGLDFAYSVGSPQSRLLQLRDTGDKCLAIGIFYLDDIERQGMYQLIDIGKASYGAAGMYAFCLDSETEGVTYSGLSEQFIRVVAEISYNMARRLGNQYPLQRLIVWTPESERIILPRN